MGKEAVRDGLKQIKLKNVKSKAEMSLGFRGGVLEMQCAYALRTDGMFGDNEIRNLLIEKLRVNGAATVAAPHLCRAEAARVQHAVVPQTTASPS